MNTLAYFVDGPARGQLAELPGRPYEWRVLEHWQPSIAMYDPRNDVPTAVSTPRTVSYQPAVLGGFLWYSHQYLRAMAFERNTSVTVPRRVWESGSHT